MRTRDALNLLINGKYTTKELDSLCGVYILTINSKHYIGSCKFLNCKSSRNGFHYRLYLHLSDLLKNRHHSTKLQNAFNKHGGINSLEFDILQDCPVELTVPIEQYWINILDVYKRGYNMNPFANSSYGRKMSDESKLKMSLAAKGRPTWNKGIVGVYKTSEETKIKISNSLKGRVKSPMSEEQREKIRNTLKGFKITKEQRKKYLETVELRKGVNHWAARKVYQYDLNGNFIREWNYVKETEQEVSSYKQVYACLENRQKTGAGFRWFYEYKGEKIEPLSVGKNQYSTRY